MVMIKNATYVGTDPPTTPVPAYTPGDPSYPAEPVEPEADPPEDPPPEELVQTTKKPKAEPSQKEEW